jgi:tubulysin polyketide synthase-like protein
MKVHDLLERLHRQGLRVAAVGPNIKVRGPKSALTPEVLESVRQQKPALLALLAAEATSAGAVAILDQLLGIGVTFEVISENGEDFLLWFGPQASVTPEFRTQITRWKPEIIRLLGEGYPRTRRTWGELQERDWRDHPGLGGEYGK